MEENTLLFLSFLTYEEISERNVRLKFIIKILKNLLHFSFKNFPSVTRIIFTNIFSNARLSMRQGSEIFICNSMTINDLNFDFNLDEISPHNDNDRFVSFKYR